MFIKKGDTMKITIIGFGEVGNIIAEELGHAHEIMIWDKKLGLDGRGKELLLEKASHLGVGVARSSEEAVKFGELIFSVVTAGESFNVVKEIGHLITKNKLFLDGNSVAPDTKAFSAKECNNLESYVDVAIMAPFPPTRFLTPLIISGPQAEIVKDLLTSLKFTIKETGKEIGYGSSIKMCRSIFIKGLEAITTECLLSARAYGIETQVLTSLHNSFPSLGWDKDFGNYLISRVAEHGLRRSEEMLEVVKTIKDKSLSSKMSQATSEKHKEFVDLMKKQNIPYQEPFVWQETADALQQ